MCRPPDIMKWLPSLHHVGMANATVSVFRVLPSPSFICEPTRCTGVWPLLCTNNFSEPYVRVGKVVRTSARSPSRGCGWLLEQKYYLYHWTLHPICCCDNNMHVTCVQRYWSDIKLFWLHGKIIAERSFRVILSVQIRFLHAPNYMIWHHGHPNWTSRHIFANLIIYLLGMSAILKTWSPSWIFAWNAYFYKRVVPKEHLCKIWCLYHNLKDSSTFCHLSASLLLVESNCCMTPKKLQESVLWHFYVLLGP